jgi:hypothetical protein
MRERGSQSIGGLDAGNGVDTGRKDGRSVFRPGFTGSILTVFSLQSVKLNSHSESSLNSSPPCRYTGSRLSCVTHGFFLNAHEWQAKETDGVICPRLRSSTCLLRSRRQSALRHLLYRHFLSDGRLSRAEKEGITSHDNCRYFPYSTGC